MSPSGGFLPLVLLALAGSVPAGRVGPRAVAAVVADPAHRTGSPALAIERELERLAAASTGDAALWPGFDPLAVPLAVFDGERTFLFRHPSPPEGYAPLPGGPDGARVRDGRDEAVTANTNTELGGVATATLLLDARQLARPVRDLAAVAAHEAFHVYERAHHPTWSGNEADLFTYPIDDADLLALRREETEALRRALAAGSEEDAACWTRAALELRGERTERMDPAYPAYERGTELNEGLATTVELRAAGRHTVDLPADGFPPTDVRRRAYATGPALALLLDRFDPGWSRELETHDDRSLDDLLATAVPEGDPCTLEASFVTGAGARARTDVQALQAGRARDRAAFESKPGWRVVVEAAPDAPLQLQGFDPLNVERLDAAHVLHRRFLRLGNAAGTLEVLGTEALTESAGSHPLFGGVRRLELTGLPEPTVAEEDGTVKVTVHGLTLTLRGATVTRGEHAVTVRLGG